MEKLNNPASRLHLILSRLKQIPGTNPCASSFAAILEVPANDQMQLHQRVARLTALMRRAREQTLASNASEDYLEWFEPVRVAFFNLNLGDNLGAFTERFSPVTLEQLRFCGIKLSERFGEPELAQEEVAHVLEEIDALIKETKESQMEESARQYVLRHLFQIAQALREYELFGVEPIREKTSDAIGSALFQQKEAQAAGKKFWEFIFDRVCPLVQTGAATNLHWGAIHEVASQLRIRGAGRLLAHGRARRIIILCKTQRTLDGGEWVRVQQFLAEKLVAYLGRRRERSMSSGYSNSIAKPGNVPGTT